ncbi:MAG TPA: penicillin acylase family protein, partial [Terriglobales bacterium]|nr:penicillin acylase family protein [Terriglobales bacterium]
LESIESAMATTTAYVSPSRPRRRTLRIIVSILVIFLLLLTVGIGVAAYLLAKSALPQLDGQINVSGLKSSVSITRDAHGVPTIEASNFDDLYFTQGYVTAQDRLWQMDGMRRFASGELSEILGPDFVEHDREQRVLGMRVAARKTLEVATPESRSHFEAYARGVTAYIESHRDHLPLEFRILHYQPKPWTPEDSALIGGQMIQDLTHYSYRSTLTREKILARLGPELTADLYVNTSIHDHPPTITHSSAGKPVSDDDDDDDSGPEDSVARNIQRLDEVSEPSLLAGSNNWVVSGAHTVSGKPLLANDMHLGHQMPNLWYEAHLKSGAIDVVGVTLPGLPYVIVGHNQRIAWGFTNVGGTVEDVYIESFNEKGQFLTPDGWQDPIHRRETIHVKEQPDEVVDVVVTRHGPIITSLIPGATRQIALRWTLYDGAHVPFFAVNSAQNWEQLLNAFSQLDAPGQNVVYADVDGNIGYHTTGKIPIRTSGDGSLPADGSNNAHEWKGYIPFDKLPSVYNPPSGIIATANARVTPDKYPYSISSGWEAPWRTDRIYQVLESGKKFSAADMLALQTDIYSSFDQFAAERFVSRVDHARNISTRVKQAADIMRGWDGRMTADSAAPTLAVKARRELITILLKSKLGPAPGVRYSWGMQSVWLENILRDQPKRWLPEKFTGYDDLFAAAVEAAVDLPDAPQNLHEWKWGAVNAVEIQNPVLGHIPLLQRWAGPGIQPQSGSGYSVKAVTRSHGPSERITDDLSNLDLSTMNIVTGQSGNFMSPHYMDQWKAWYEGTTFLVPYSAQAVENSRAHKLVLQPTR